MSAERMPVGSVGWIDLTVPAAGELRDFYTEVVGWSAAEHSMGDYADYVMSDEGGAARAGVCHARGVNAGLPAAWIAYFVVADLDASLARVRARGGEVLSGPRGEGDRFAVIRDPAGAVCALYQQR